MAVHQHNLAPSPGSRRKGKPRLGRGAASGKGNYSGKGRKGQKSRGRMAIRSGFEGGQLPKTKALPHLRGFRNPFSQEYAVVNLSKLAAFSSRGEVDPRSLLDMGIVKDAKKPIKVLGQGEAPQGLTVKAHKFSRSAREKLLAAGGVVEEVPFAKG